jgi:hypothetical protein
MKNTVASNKNFFEFTQTTVKIGCYELYLRLQLTLLIEEKFDNANKCVVFVIIRHHK